MTQFPSHFLNRLEDSYLPDPKIRKRKDGVWESSKLFQKEEIPPLAEVLINCPRCRLQRCEKGMDMREEMVSFNNVYKR